MSDACICSHESLQVSSALPLLSGGGLGLFSDPQDSNSCLSTSRNKTFLSLKANGFLMLDSVSIKETGAGGGRDCCTKIRGREWTVVGSGKEAADRAICKSDSATNPHGVLIPP